MLIISHRGNLNGPDKSKENNPDHIDRIISENLVFDVEIDLRVHKQKLYLGHDECEYVINQEWLFQHVAHLWIHCKNAEALRYCSQLEFFHHYFWHNTDDYTLTNKNIIWAYPGKPKVDDFTVLVMPEQYWNTKEIEEIQPFGVCTDYVETYKYINKT